MRKSISAELKAKVALEAVKGQKTINELASIYEVQPAQVSACKKQIQDSATSVFGKSKDKHYMNRKRIRMYSNVEYLFYCTNIMILFLMKICWTA